MVTIETTTHVGADGILRVEAPVALRNQDVRVVLVVQAHPSQRNDGEQEPATRDGAREARLKVAGIIPPPKGAWNSVPVEALALEIPGSSISETVVNDRR